MKKFIKDYIKTGIRIILISFWKNLEFQRQKISECSSGMQKILSIALSLSYNPQLLIFDEPTTTLDPVRRKDILGIFQEFVLDENKTVIFQAI